MNQSDVQSGTDGEEMHTQWETLMETLGVDPDLADEVFADLVMQYKGGRYYHTLEHVQVILNTVESLRQYAKNLPVIQLAAWFHDVIYDPHANNNEEQSAIYAERVLRRMQISDEKISAVKRMIRATQVNQPPCYDPDCQILLDADLVSLASDWAQQEKINEAIRQEYAFVPNDLYRVGRRQVLQSFLDRERIYYTEPMFTAFEQRARNNITRILDELITMP